MSTYFAQPYDISANGFYFDDYEDYTAKRWACRNDYGQPVEEFEIQFIDGDDIDAALFSALGINQSNLKAYLDQVEDREEYEKQILIIAVGECGYSFNIATGSPNDFDVVIYHVKNMEELARQFVDEGLFGDIPENIQCYLDYYAISCDLAMDYSETTIAGENIIYRCS